jgi:hypothetical protein
MKQQLAFKSTYLRENCYISGAIVNVVLAKHILGNVDISIIKTYSTLDEIFQAKRR